uniref:ATP synthase complex subunit 8 n=1 Tax=Agonosoma flavolineatum TaxID=2080385 RepID=A0A2P1CLQ0_9HEMI|nr:ATP synthase F0 subunit 8 [Agonosoma flavolineatum]
MPQMAPLYWELLFIMFIVSLIIMSIILFHMPKITSSTKMNYNQLTNQINWKW